MVELEKLEDTLIEIADADGRGIILEWSDDAGLHDTAGEPIDCLSATMEPGFDYGRVVTVWADGSVQAHENGLDSEPSEATFEDAAQVWRFLTEGKS